jgi:CRISP-associated protein Cas1
MAWRGVHISKESRLNLKAGQLFVRQADGDVSLPLEDIAYVVLDAPHISITSSLLSKMMEQGVALITIDERHNPNGLLLPFMSHHRQAGLAKQQIIVSEPFKKRLWQAIIRAKITNQAENLKTHGKKCDALFAMAKRVNSGDPENIEARAARDYWGNLFDDFIRDNESDIRNKMLNYGYAIMRAAIARALVASGFIPCFGIHHESVTNSFNLADDLIEPFRPFVDNMVFRETIGRAKQSDLTLDDKRRCAALLHEDCLFEDETISLLVATEKCVQSLSRAYENGSAAELSLPKFLKLSTANLN